ncbi:MAG: hypothetical protein ACE5IK_00955 [Acidobacteriota bacterium]
MMMQRDHRPGIMVWTVSMAVGCLACTAAEPDPLVSSTPDTGSLVGGHAGVAGGLRWTAPAAWTPAEAAPMRAASYRVPGGPGEPGDIDISVSFFPGAGGGEEANLARWTGQFRSPVGGPPEGVISGNTRVAGFPVATLDVSGTYQGGPRGGGPFPGYRLFAAIVQGPQGPVFFKMVGPAGGVDRAKSGFDAMLHSVTAAP